ncbi:hypothetical protein EZS27_017122 [termite gut metagenome]|uniref:Uncharacterized protein n=1 Tax=termite gut metagenome TaxID=433724 RepID=A0A5J4RMG2_9ZZZZ
MNLCIMKIDTIVGSYKCFKKRPLSDTNKIKILLILKNSNHNISIFYISINKSQIFSKLLSICLHLLSNNSSSSYLI